MDRRLIVQIAGAIAAALAVGAGGGTLGYNARDNARDDAFERAKCKLRDAIEAAEACGWVRPGDWCALEER